MFPTLFVADDIISIINWVKEIWSSFSLLFWLLIAPYLVFWILGGIIDVLIVKPREARERSAEYEAGLRGEAARPMLREFHKHEVEARRKEMIKEA